MYNQSMYVGAYSQVIFKQIPVHPPELDVPEDIDTKW